MDTNDINTKGIILEDFKYGETSKIVRILTREYGKLSILVKGAYKIKSPYLALTQPYTEVDISLRKGQSFYYIQRGEALDCRLSLRSTYEALILAGLFSEIVQKTMEEEERNVKVYDLLSKTLSLLENRKNANKVLLCSFLVKYISFIGYRPTLEQCISCRNTVNRPRKFDVSQGGILCSNCSGSLKHTVHLEEKSIYYLKKILYTSLDRLQELNIDRININELLNILIQTLQYHMDIEDFFTLKLLHDM